MIAAGTPVPPFSVVDESGNTVTQDTLKGRWAALYFYPRDETPGCTAQACSLRDSIAEFESRDMAVYGISADTAKSHQKFKANHQLPFPLLADTDHSMAEAFGVWVEKSMYGKKYMGIERSTAIINPEGMVAASFEKVKPEDHASFLLKEIDALLAA